MPGFRLSQAAMADLGHIARHTGTRWGRAQRNRSLVRLDEAFHLLAARPGIGTPADGVRRGYRRFTVGAHVIWYRTGAGGRVEVIRVLHKHMLPTRRRLG